MPTIDLNILQERELARLLDYERATCTVDGDLVYHCAFPYRPDDDLQVELIAHGALMQKIDNDISVQPRASCEPYHIMPLERRRSTLTSALVMSSKREARFEDRESTKREAAAHFASSPIRLESARRKPASPSSIILSYMRLIA